MDLGKNFFPADGHFGDVSGTAFPKTSLGDPGAAAAAKTAPA